MIGISVGLEQNVIRFRPNCKIDTVASIPHRAMYQRLHLPKKLPLHPFCYCIGFCLFTFCNNIKYDCISTQFERLICVLRIFQSIANAYQGNIYVVIIIIMKGTMGLFLYCDFSTSRIHLYALFCFFSKVGTG